MAGPPDQAPPELKPILDNKDAAQRRGRPVAIINAKDGSDPSDLGNPGVSSWIKMSAPSIEGLRQAFLYPGSRNELNTDPQGEPHAQFVAIRVPLRDGCDNWPWYYDTAHVSALARRA